MCTSVTAPYAAKCARSSAFVTSGARPPTVIRFSSVSFPFAIRFCTSARSSSVIGARASRQRASNSRVALALELRPPKQLVAVVLGAVQRVARARKALPPALQLLVQRAVDPQRELLVRRRDLRVEAVALAAHRGELALRRLRPRFGAGDLVALRLQRRLELGAAVDMVRAERLFAVPAFKLGGSRSWHTAGATKNFSSSRAAKKCAASSCLPFASCAAAAGARRPALVPGAHARGGGGAGAHLHPEVAAAKGVEAPSLLQTAENTHHLGPPADGAAQLAVLRRDRDRDAAADGGGDRRHGLRRRVVLPPRLHALRQPPQVRPAALVDVPRPRAAVRDQYGTGATGGPSYLDTISIGDLRVPDHPIGLATDVDPMLERFPFSGVVGMSYPMENEPAGFVPLFDTIMKERILERVGPIERALALERDADGADAAAAAKDAAAKRARGKSAVALAFDMERRRMLGVGTPALHPQFSFFLSKHPKNSASCAAPPPRPPPRPAHPPPPPSSFPPPRSEPPPAARAQVHVPRRDRRDARGGRHQVGRRRAQELQCREVGASSLSTRRRSPSRVPRV